MAADADRPAELARYYDLDLEGYRDDIELYLTLAADARQTILELACGTGRIALPLAAAGHEVVGVDIDPAMLARARAAWTAQSYSEGGSLTLVEHDLTTLDLGRTFDLVILGLNTLPMLAGRDAQLAGLRVAAHHLNRPGGRAVIDLFLPTDDQLAAYDGTLALAWQRKDRETGAEVAKIWAADYDPDAPKATITTFFDSWPAEGGAVRRISRRDELNLLDATSVQALVAAAGMKVERVAGDYSLAAYGTGGEGAVIVCSLL